LNAHIHEKYVKANFRFT